jgi:Na+/melibiose symporter and related transporters
MLYGYICRINLANLFEMCARVCYTKKVLLLKERIMLKFNELSHKLFGTTEGDDDIQPKEGWAFSIAGFGQNLVCTIIGSYLMAFMTEGMGFDSEMMLFGTGKWQTGAMAVAWLMLFTRIFDACNDPIMGSIVDRTRTKWGKCRPYLKWMPVPIAFMTAMCFLPFFPTTKTGFWIVAVVYVTWSVAYTIVDVPYWGLSTAMTNDTTKRGNMLTIARLCCTAGAGLVTIFIPVLTGNIPKWRGLMVESVKLDAANNIVFDKNGAVVKEWVIKSGMQLQYQNCLKMDILFERSYNRALRDSDVLLRLQKH